MPIKELREDRRPADLWFWKDWFSSFEVRCCSLAARGLWIDMLGVMRNADIKGCLTVNGEQIDSKDLAKIAGASEDEVSGLLKELEAHKVFSRLEDGTIINRRMYREGDLSRKRADAGKKGADSRWQDDGKPDSKPMAPLANGNEYAIVSSQLNTEERTKIIVEVVAYLNEKAGKKFNPRAKATAGYINARLDEGRTLDDFKKVIDLKVEKWKGRSWKHTDTGQLVNGDDYLRPSTLFRPENFENYVNESPAPPRPRQVGESMNPPSKEWQASMAKRNDYEDKLWNDRAHEIEGLRQTLKGKALRDARDKIEGEIRNQVAAWVNSGMPENQKQGALS